MERGRATGEAPDLHTVTVTLSVSGSAAVI